MLRLNDSDPVSELLAAIGGLNSEKKDEVAISKQLSHLLLRQSAAELAASNESIAEAAESEKSLLRTTGLAAMISAGQADAAFELAQKKPAAKVDFLRAVPLLEKTETRNSLRESLVGLCDPTESIDVRRAAIASLATISVSQPETFQLVANFVTEPKLRRAAIKDSIETPS